MLSNSYCVGWKNRCATPNDIVGELGKMLIFVVMSAIAIGGCIYTFHLMERYPPNGEITTITGKIGASMLGFFGIALPFLGVWFYGRDLGQYQVETSLVDSKREPIMAIATSTIFYGITSAITTLFPLLKFWTSNIEDISALVLPGVIIGIASLVCLILFIGDLFRFGVIVGRNRERDRISEQSEKISSA